MALGPRLDLRQSQSLVMTPQLQQAIRLLALSNLEIEAFIAEEIEKNPLLETAPSDNEGRDGEEPPLTDIPLTDDPVRTDILLDQGEGAGGNSLDADYEAETFHHDSAADSGPGMDGGLGASGGGQGSEDGSDFDSMAADAPSLHDHLMGQAGTAFRGADMLLASHLIDQIDESGYLSVPLLEIANRMGVSLARVEGILATIQTFDPTGVGARTLSECLALQVKELDRYDPAMARLIDNLDLLAQGRVPQLRRMCGVDEEDMSDMIRELRALDPKPGLRFGGERIQAVTPDVYVAERGKGWAIEINTASLPRLLVNRTYYAELSAGGHHDKASKAWLGDCLTTANWLVKALDQRQRTIIKVASEIVKQQDAFFRKGVAHLRPLTLRMVADAIGMHESTVSRVTSNKYMSCARGLFELKYFFTSSVAASDGGEAVSAEAVKNMIRTLIIAEKADAILSDDTLVEMLNSHGFDLARRTVAKYREAIGIGSSVQRRRARALQSHAA
ncbi:MAG: RNA polymerase factor sigma-54 [Chakrabartia sp.]